MSVIAVLTSLGSLATRAITSANLAQQIDALLGDLGEQEFRNAQQAFRDAQTSKAPRHELTNAINHLQSAATIFESRQRRISSSDLYSIYKEDMIPLFEKQCLCYATIAAIYASQGERELMLTYTRFFCDTSYLYLSYIKKGAQGHLRYKEGFWSHVLTDTVDDVIYNIFTSKREKERIHREVSRKLAQEELDLLVKWKREALAFLGKLNAPIGRLNELPERVDQLG